MSWFKKSCNVKVANLNSLSNNRKEKELQNRTQTSSTQQRSTMRRRFIKRNCNTSGVTASASGGSIGQRNANDNKNIKSLNPLQIELVDPEDFFQDPEHVRNYKDEAQFLSIMADWVIVEHPERTINTDNYFSADFEEQFVLRKTQTVSTSSSLLSADQSNWSGRSSNATASTDNVGCSGRANTTLQLKQCLQEEERRKQHEHEQRRFLCKRRICDLLFGDSVQNGIALPKRQKIYKPHKLKNIPSAPPAPVQTSSESIGCEMYMKENSSCRKTVCPKRILKDCAIDREQLKNEALANSIMGAIGKCPNRDITPGSSLADLIEQTGDNCHPAPWSGCDHYDIKQSFRLDDNGNILLSMNHIEEKKACGFDIVQNDRLYRKFLKDGQKAEERSYCQRRGCLELLKRLLRFLWQLFTGHPRNKINPYGSNSGPGDSVRAYTLQLAHDQSSTFARNIENFISCTKESREAAPQVVMRNMRQFMNGMKNYLVKHGEGKFQQEVEAARSRLKADEFLNLDAILETVMHQLVVLPLREHLYGMFVDYYTRSEDIQLLAQNVKYACGRNAADFGIRNSVTPPASGSLHVISNLLLRLQEAELPLEKLDLFLCVISTIFDATGCPRGQHLGADDFLPILVYVVAKCGFVGAEIEAEFMWGLLQPTLLNGEPGYYLTALCSAVHVLKSFMASENENGTGSLDWRASSLPACSSVLRVIIPDECNGSLQTRTLPVRPHTTTREVCRIIAHKARITNPQDYALFKLIDGEETPLNESECPQDIRLAAKGKHCMLAYKRIDAKIAWPTTTQPIYN